MKSLFGNMAALDWSIVLVAMTFFTVMAYRTKKYTLGVADFLAANRCAGRYVLAIGDGMAGLGAISAIGAFQQYFEGGFTPIFWNTTVLLFGLTVAISGWVIYRFRQTRALTWPQFFELRYSRRFRIFAGILCFTSGIVNFGIFPSVAARFMVYYGGLPEWFGFAGYDWSTYGVVMAGMIAMAVWYACLGGQIAVIVTDFLQGLFCNIVFVIVLIFLFVKFSWSDITVALVDRPEGQSMLNPFQIKGNENYDLWYYIIGMFVAFYGAYSWQGQQGYNTSAKNPHEARMSKILGMLRPLTYTLLLLMLPICVYTLLHNPKFELTPQVAEINQALSQIDNEQVRSQMTVPVSLVRILPIGLVGLFCAVIFAFFTSTVDTYLHSWGSILMQDIILPLRKKHIPADKHMMYLRWSIVGVAIFIWFFSYFFQQKSDIFMFFALSGMIYLCGQGAVTIGGMYWKRATTAGAWVAMILNLPVFALAFTCDQYWPRIASWLQNDHQQKWVWLCEKFPELNAKEFLFTHQEIFFWGIVLCLVAFVVVSLLTTKKPFDLDKMLHRGKYSLESDRGPEGASGKWNWKDVVGFKKGMSAGDLLIFVFAYTFLLCNLLIIVTMVIWHVVSGTDDDIWMTYWHIFVWANLILTVVLIVWFAIGGLRDLADMLRTLATARRDEADDGTVIDHHNVGE